MLSWSYTRKPLPFESGQRIISPALQWLHLLFEKLNRHLVPTGTMLGNPGIGDHALEIREGVLTTLILQGEKHHYPKNQWGWTERSVCFALFSLFFPKALLTFPCRSQPYLAGKGFLAYQNYLLRVEPSNLCLPSVWTAFQRNQPQTSSGIVVAIWSAILSMYWWKRLLWFRDFLQNIHYIVTHIRQKDKIKKRRRPWPRLLARERVVETG